MTKQLTNRMQTMLFFAASTRTRDLSTDLDSELTACIILEDEVSGAFFSNHIESDTLNIVGFFHKSLS